MNNRTITSLLQVCALLACATLHTPALADSSIAFDGSLGPAGEIPRLGDTYTIPQSAGRTVGTNLFHSFSRFGLEAGEVGEFTGNAVSNVISRVTGGSRSVIDGTLRSSMAGANFFFINPQGVVFGPNAQLDVSGSFHASSADYLRFSDGSRFYADPSRTSNLVAVNPTAFGFLGPKPNGVRITGSYLKVPDGQTISVVGGPVATENVRLQAKGGQINLVAVDSAGEVRLEETGVSLDGVAQRADITVTRTESLIPIPGKTDWVYGDIEVGGWDPGEPGGTLTIRGRNFSLLGGSVGNNHFGDQPGGNVDVGLTGTLLIDDTGPDVGYCSFQTTAYAQGRGGDILIAAAAVELVNGGYLWAGTEGPGPGGDIVITADTLTLDRSGSVMVDSAGRGRGGDVAITAARVTLRDGGSITADALGDGDPATRDGDAGDITLNVDTLEMSGLDDWYASISSSSFGSGDGGRVTINASDSVLLTGYYYSPWWGLLANGVYATSYGSGNGGDIAITTPAFTTQLRAVVSTSSYGSGAGGNIAVNAADALRVWYLGQVLARTTGSGAGGDVTLAAGDLTVAQGGVIYASTEGSGAAGNITLNVDTLEMWGDQYNQSRISSTSWGSGPGGLITVNANESVHLRDYYFDGTTFYDNGIQVSANSSGDGGSVIINAPVVLLENWGAVLADAWESGAGGGITLNGSQQVMLANGGYLAADTIGSGNGGAIRVTTPALTLLNGAEIRTNSDGDGVPATQDGNAGAITLTVGNLTLTGTDIGASRVTSVSRGSGRGGEITVNADGAVLLAGFYIDDQWELSNNGLFVTSYGSGAGGGIALTADTVELVDGGTLEAETRGAGVGGAITVTGNDTVRVGRWATMSAITSGTGRGGSILVNAPHLILEESGMITASTNGDGDPATRDGNAGDVVLEVGTLAMSGSDGNVSQVLSTTDASGDGGTVVVRASESVTIDGAAELFPGAVYQTGIIVTSQDGSSGQGGSIRIETPALSVTGGGTVAARTRGSGDAGRIDIVAGERVTVSGRYREELPDSGSSILVGTIASGQGGPLVLQTGELVVTEGGQVSATTEGSGAGGSLTIRADDSILVTGPGSGIVSESMGGSGDAGGILLATPTLTVADRGEVSTASDGSGRAGDVTIQELLQTLTLSGGAAISSSNSGTGDAGRLTLVAALTTTLDAGTLETEAASGQGGVIDLTTGALLLDNGSRISATVAGGAGRGGDLLLTLDTLRLQGESRIESSTGGLGDGGSITITSREAHLLGGGTIASNSLSPLAGAGRAGSITLTANDLLYMAGGNLSSAAVNGGGGNITIRVRDTIRLVDSAVSTSVQGGDGRGGNIDIDPIYLILERSRLSANAYQGAGGNIVIRTQTLLQDTASAITASSALGVQGTVQVETPEVNVMEGLLVLPTQFFDASGLLSNPCSARPGSGVSTLVMGSRGGLPTMPGDLRAGWYGTPGRTLLPPTPGQLAHWWISELAACLL